MQKNVNKRANIDSIVSNISFSMVKSTGKNRIRNKTVLKQVFCVDMRKIVEKNEKNEETRNQAKKELNVKYAVSSC